MTEATATFDELRQGMECARPTCPCHKDRYLNRHCPAHDDSSPSLTVVKQPSGKVTVHCKTGCSQDAVIESLRNRMLWPVDTEVRDPRAVRRTKLTKEWDYVDPGTGEIVAVHGRHNYIDRDPETGELGKVFKWRLPTGTYGQGLQGLPLNELPLYNAALIEAEPEETIWITEGEKAADAATDHGLIAVSLPGGAGQTSFGNQLDWLQVRNVVLWSDNDEVGRGLMTRVASMLPHAKTVTPPGTQLKGDDAYDFFARDLKYPNPDEEGEELGSVEALLLELKDPEPIARQIKGGVEVEHPTPKGSIAFTFQQISPQQNTLRAYVEITHQLEGRPKGICSQRIDIVSGSQQNALTTRLRSMFGSGRSDEINWTSVVNTACRLAEEAHVNSAHAVALDQVEDDGGEDYMIGGFLPKGQLTTMFADGGSGKTYLSLHLALMAIMGGDWLGRPVRSPVENVLFVDYESTPEVIRRRFMRVCRGAGYEPADLMGHFHYFPGRGIPLEHQANQLERELNRTGSKLMIVDSAAAAAGGEPERAESALSVFNTLALVGVDITTLLIAHNNAAGETMKPFGSVFWHNNSRMTHYLAGSQPAGANYIHVGVWNRKVNDDTLQPAWGVRIEFDGAYGPVTFEAENLDSSVKPSRKKNAGMAIMGILQNNEAMLTQDLHAALEEDGIEIKAQSLRNTLSRMKERGVVTSEVTRGRNTLWSVVKVDDREVAEQGEMNG